MIFRTLFIVFALITMSTACSPKERWCDVNGMVLDSDGRPISGASVRGLSYRHAEDAYFSVPKAVVTDSGGRFTLRLRRLSKGPGLVGMTLEASTGEKTTQQRIDIGVDCNTGGEIRMVPLSSVR